MVIAGDGTGDLSDHTSLEIMWALERNAGPLQARRSNDEQHIKSRGPIVSSGPGEPDPRGDCLNDVIACTAGAMGVTVVDLHPLFEGRTFELTHIGINDVHPTNKGHRIIAIAVIDAAS
ncbi:MAG: SGNH/GDSL hydrolase family protein [Chloroflexi bacterium]|nr:SGNH/GDSL hydrolase family protein [Chloroflexota bacterium]